MPVESGQLRTHLDDLGPIQILTVAFDGNHFKGEILPELERLKQLGLIRLVDMLLVRKDSTGAVATLTATDLDWEELADFGGSVGELIGWGVAGAAGAEAGWLTGAADSAGGHHFDENEEFALLQMIPNGSSAAIVLIEHVWEKPLREAIRRANGHEVVNNWLNADDLIRAGMAGASPSADEATP